MSGQEIEAVIFDCDGTLVDSETLSIQVLVDQIGELGLQLNYERAVEQFSGNDLSVVLEDVETQLGHSLPTDFLDDFRHRQIDVLREQLQPVAGAADLLASVEQQTCVASNAPVEKISACLATTGLDRFFSPGELFSAYQIQMWKPAPDLFLLAAQTMGIAPEKCAVVEDSRFGIEAGISAGMQVFAYSPNLEHHNDERVTAVEQLTDLTPLLRGGSFLSG